MYGASDLHKDWISQSESKTFHTYLNDLFSLTKPSNRTKNSRCGSIWCLWYEFKKILGLYVDKLPPAVSLWATDVLVRPQQQEAGSTDPGPTSTHGENEMWFQVKKKSIYLFSRHMMGQNLNNITI